MIMLILYGVGIIIVIVVVFALLGMIAQMLPYLIGGAVILGLGYLISLALKSDTRQVTTYGQMNHGSEIDVAIEDQCRSIYESESDVNACINKGGSI